MANQIPLSGMGDLQISTNNMLLDSSEYDTADDGQDVTNIEPQLQGEADEDMADDISQGPLTANNFERMKSVVLPDLPDLETEHEAVWTWEVKGWRSMARRVQSPVFDCGGQPWRILFFPYGNNVEFASFYLEQGHAEKPPEEWYACVQFALVMWNPNEPSMYISHYAHHRFTPEESDWGFTRYADLRRLFADQWDGFDRPMVEDEAVNVTAYVRIIKDPTGVLWHNFLNYDSKKQTGFVGLKNQGATCYLNSLLQSLHFTNAFRKAVYQIPTENEETLSNCAYTLQRLFYQLQTNNDAVSTLELTKSFGWDSRQVFEQQDVQELSRILMERLETKMKGTEAEKSLEKLFLGTTKTYISCINVDYESSRREDFWDLQLNVRGIKSLQGSLEDYIKEETMEGENKYDAGGHGFQDARKGVIFEGFPPVLHLQLKRFEYDINRDAMMKVNDYYEFPETFDASPYLSESADRSEPYIYKLHGVLVHSGDLHAGHYYAFLKPTKNGPFYRFEDDRVTRSTMKEVLHDNFGGEYSNLPNGSAGVQNAFSRTVSTKRSMNAYMLVYLRESRLDEVLCEVTESDVPHHLERKLEEERLLREQKKKEREEQHLYMDAHVVTTESFKHHQGLDLVKWDQTPDHPAASKHYRVLRAMKVEEFTKLVAPDVGCEPERLRLWVMVNRQNKTVRPDQPLHNPATSLEDAFNRLGTKPLGFRLWAEVAETMVNDKPLWPDQMPATNGNSNILLFLKYFNMEEQTLYGVGHVYVRRHEKVQDITTPILKLMKWTAGVQIKLFEEIKPSMIEPMKPKQTLQQAEIQDGDIICFQKEISEKKANSLIEQGASTDCREFYDFIVNKITVHFERLGAPEPSDEDKFSLELSRRTTYDKLANQVGKRLRVEPTHLRFSTVNATTGAPKQTIRRQYAHTLQHILFPNYTYTNSTKKDGLYYEILEESLSEVEQKKAVKITFAHEGITKEEHLEVLVAKNGTLADALPLVAKKVKLDDESAKHLRVFQVHNHKIFKELPVTYAVVSLNEYVNVLVEVIPKEELEADPDDRPIFAFQYDREPSKTHGIPFKFMMKPGEVFKDTKKRLEKRIGIKGKQFERIKFSIIPKTASYTKPVYINDDDILADVAAQEWGAAQECSLGLDHVDRSRSSQWPTSLRDAAIFIRR